MGIPTPDELRHKLTISWGLAVAYTIILVLASFSVGKMLDDDHQREELKQHLEEKIINLHQFSLDEVGGLRADWERDRADQNKRIEKIEDKLND